ncbi:MAG: O-antigen/teichoic acid export membrane protein [Halioglobus sp.]|jgi:O-antigen/teichoic acid export membrane protein
MSLRTNTLANLIGQLYRALIGILMLPAYLLYLGDEAYGLVAFYALLSTWLLLLAAGVAPMLARQVAYARGEGTLGSASFRLMLRGIEIIVLIAGLLIALVGSLGSDWLAVGWLSVGSMDLAEVSNSIVLMAIVIGLAPGAALYASGINGLERQVWLNAFNVVFATLRYGGAYVMLRWFTQDIQAYFEYQVLMGVLELLLLAWKFYRCQPAGSSGNDPGVTFSWKAIRPVLPFTAGIAYTSVLWVGMTQSDKLVLSNTLTLVEFGYFGIVGLLANGILLFSIPVTRAALPRMTMYYSQERSESMLLLYRTITQLLVAIVFSIAVVLAWFPHAVLYALSGSESAAQWGAQVLPWYVVGNAVLVIAGLQYNLQFVHGQVRLHVVQTTINAAVQIPILVYVALNYGVVAVAQTWLVIRVVTFLVWPAIVHRRFAPGMHWRWMLGDVCVPLFGACFGLAFLVMALSFFPNAMVMESRVASFAALFFAGLFVLFVSSFSGSEIRKILLGGLRDSLKLRER